MITSIKNKTESSEWILVASSENLTTTSKQLNNLNYDSELSPYDSEDSDYTKKKRSKTNLMTNVKNMIS